MGEKKKARVTRIITREKIEKYLEVIGWRLRHMGCQNYLFIDNNEQHTELTIWNNRITSKGENYEICMYTKDMNMELMQGHDTVSFVGKNDKSLFINLYSHKKSY